MPSTRKPPVTLCAQKKTNSEPGAAPGTFHQRRKSLSSWSFLPIPASVPFSPGHLPWKPRRGDSKVIAILQNRRGEGGFQSLWPEAVSVSLKSQGVGGAL